MPKVYDAQGNYLHDAEPMPPESIIPTADERLDATRQALAAVANLTGPVLAADVADVLADLRTALEA